MLPFWLLAHLSECLLAISVFDYRRLAMKFVQSWFQLWYQVSNSRVSKRLCWLVDSVVPSPVRYVSIGFVDLLVWLWQSWTRLL